jgi:hypothetical protein
MSRVLATVLTVIASALLLAGEANATTGIFGNPFHRTAALGAPALVQTEKALVTSGTTVRSTFASPTTAGNLVVAYVVWDNTGTASVSDGRGNAYAPAGLGRTTWANSRYAAQVFYAKNIKGGTTTVKARFGRSASSFGILYIHEYSGIDRANPLDVARASKGTGTAMDSGAVTTTTARELLFGAGASIGSVTNGGPGFTVRSTEYGNLTQDRNVTTAGSYGSTATHTGGGWVMQVAAFRAEGVVEDTTPPSVPADLIARASSSSEIELGWSAATDDVGVAGYDVYRDGAPIGTTSGTSYRDTGLSPDTTYSYAVSARDAAGNSSARSAGASATTPPLPPVPTLEPVDGGPAWYGQFSNPLPTDPGFFPIGVWFESVAEQRDVDTDTAAGLNTYVELTASTDLSLVRAGGSHAIHSGEPTGAGTETKGWLLTDEVDMWAGPGHAGWTGNWFGEVCIPSNEPCGYTVLETLNSRLPGDDRMRYTNFGKGVTFWETDAEAAEFLNGGCQDLVSADNYWFTDRAICGPSEGGGAPGVVTDNGCAVAANYGWTVQRVRNLVQPSGSRPVWAFVEVGHPSTQPDWPSITPPEVRAAVWHSLIAGARGVIYFNHSFAGPCPTQHALREPCYAAIRSAVTETNQQITALAPVLNAPTVTSGWSHGDGTRALMKWADGHFYLFAGSAGSAVTESFSVPCVGNATATVVGEDRAIPVVSGSFTDSYVDANTVHIYRIDGAGSCGLPGQPTSP